MANSAGDRHTQDCPDTGVTTSGRQNIDPGNIDPGDIDPSDIDPLAVDRPGKLQPTSFSALAGWREADHRPAFAAFLNSAVHLASTAFSRPKTRDHGISGNDLCAIARHALAAGPDIVAAGDGSRARAFFERWFTSAQVSAQGFFTAYFEPEARASRHRTPEFPVPLYRRPDDLVDVTDENRPGDWDPEIRFARASRQGLLPYADRVDIESGALAGRDLELVWLADPVTAFFIHVQGSARLRLTDGTSMRVAYAAKAGHAYTSIGKRAVAQGFLHRDRCGKAELEAWLHANPGPGARLMQENRSFIFFREMTGLDETDGPVGAAGVPLTAGYSLAVDRRWTTFHTPVWVAADGVGDPDAQVVDANDSIADKSGGGQRRFARLMIAQDTGSAIVGPARGDLFFGSGNRAGALAGSVRAQGHMTLLVPKRQG